MKRESSLDALLDLDGQLLFVDPEARCWVQFVVRRVMVSEARPHRLDYSLTLHGPDGERLVGFDNAHPVKIRSGRDKRGDPSFDHRHRLKAVRPCEYEDAVALLAELLDD